MTVLVIDTGGTIGMVRSADGWAPSPGRLERVTRGLPGFDDDLEWLNRRPLLDSSALGPADWNELASDIAAAEYRVQGIIIAHGTDTMAYTASALSFLLPDVACPVVLTGSQTPLAVAGSDGWNNLVLARAAAGGQVGPGIRVAMNNTLFAGAHVTKTDAEGPAVMAAPFGVPDYPVRRAPPQRPACPIEPQSIRLHHCLPGALSGSLQALVNEAPRVLILRTYGVGNTGLTDDDVGVLDRAGRQGTLLVNHSQCLRANVDMARYAAAAPLQRLGVTGSGTMTLEALVTKLLVLLSQAPDQDNSRLAEALLTAWHYELPCAERRELPELE